MPYTKFLYMNIKQQLVQLKTITHIGTPHCIYFTKTSYPHTRYIFFFFIIACALGKSYKLNWLPPQITQRE